MTFRTPLDMCLAQRPRNGLTTPDKAQVHSSVYIKYMKATSHTSIGALCVTCFKYFNRELSRLNAGLRLLPGRYDLFKNCTLPLRLPVITPGLTVGGIRSIDSLHTKKHTVPRPAKTLPNLCAVGLRANSERVWD